MFNQCEHYFKTDCHLQATLARAITSLVVSICLDARMLFNDTTRISETAMNKMTNGELEEVDENMR